MNATSTMRTRSLPMVPTRMATPPPMRHILSDVDKRVGWIDGRAVGFTGFADEVEAMNAAWVGYRTMSRNFARALGHRPIPIDTEQLSLEQSGKVEMILAAGRPVARLVRPAPSGTGNAGSFGFELQLPIPTNDATVRRTADLVYRSLRRSGIRWELWTPAARAPAMAMKPETAVAMPTARPHHLGPDVIGTRTWPRRLRAVMDRLRTLVSTSSTMAAALVSLTILTLIALPAISASHLTTLLGSVAAAVALVALGSLVMLVVNDVARMLRGAVERREARGPGQPYSPLSNGA